MLVSFAERPAPPACEPRPSRSLTQCLTESRHKTHPHLRRPFPESRRTASQDPWKALRPRSTVGRDADAELDLDFVAELECAEERRVRPDSPPGLHDCRRALQAACGQPAVHRDWLGGAGDGQSAVDAERLSRPFDPCRPEGDRRVLPGVQDLLADGLLDLRAVGVGERLDTAASIPALPHADAELDLLPGTCDLG